MKDFAKAINERLGTKITSGRPSYAFKEAYSKVMTTNLKLLEIIKKLRANYKIAVISNAIKLGQKIVKARNLWTNFDVSIVSCEVGMIKPEKEIFELALRKLTFPAEECIFIDDREEHLEMPTQMGFKVVHFKTNQQLIEDLKKFGVEV